MSLQNSYQHIDNSKSIIDPFFNSLDQYASRNALWVDKNYKTYAELFELAKKPALWLNQFDSERVLIFSQRTLPAYQGILASLMVGKAYVPLNPKMPAPRNAMMVDLVDSNLVLADHHELKQLMEVLSEFPNSTFEVLVLNHEDESPLDGAQSNIKIHYLDQITTEIDFKPTPHESTNDDACLLFTSGSTGKPKGVMLSHENILSYIRHTIERYRVTKDDRISQITELTFDFSVQDIFMSWAVGACVYAFPENYFIGLPRYLNENKITFMTTVPSTARLLNNLGKLTKGSFPFLRQNIFGGEPFSDSIAALWQDAAPNTIIDNVCGPTEATIAYLSYTWDKAVAEQKGPRDCIPLGHPFPGQEISILDTELKPVRSSEIGELYRKRHSNPIYTA